MEIFLILKSDLPTPAPEITKQKNDKISDLKLVRDREGESERQRRQITTDSGS